MNNFNPVKEAKLTEIKVGFAEYFFKFKFQYFILAVIFHVFWKLIGFYSSWWWVIGALGFYISIDVYFYIKHPLYMIECEI